MDAEYARVESSTNDRENFHQIDAQMVKTHYPRDNNDKGDGAQSMLKFILVKIDGISQILSAIINKIMIVHR